MGWHRVTACNGKKSYCVRMVELGAPCIATDAQHTPSYNDVPINSDLTIGAYIGLPLVDRDNQQIGRAHV